LSDRVKGKLALVTAAGQGIGRASSLALAREGATVIATDINGDTLADLEREAATDPSVTGSVNTRIMDALERSDIEATIAALDPIDVLVNCAGFVHHGNILECTEEEWDFAFDLNVKSMYRLSKAVLPGMLGKKSGSIVNIASIGAHQGLLNRFAYGASKAAVLGLTLGIAKDFVGDGIRCNAISPGTVQTPSLDGRIAAFDDPVAARQQFINRQPMGRLGEPEEIAAAVVYLASEETVFMSGQNICVDGGMSI